MKSNNIVPFKGTIQAEIEREIARALAKFGDDNVEVMAIVCSCATPWTMAKPSKLYAS